MKIHPFVFVIATFLFGGMATADNLPQQAVKLTSQEVVAIYSGKTIEWRRSRAVFSPDGTFLLVGKNDEFVASGTWSVRENELCASYELMDLKGSSTKKARIAGRGTERVKNTGHSGTATKTRAAVITMTS